MNRLLFLLHLYGVIVWIGGMVFAHFCLRPVAAEQLPPPQRLPFLAAVLGRFFKLVGVALGLIWLSGGLRFIQTGGAVLPLHWHVMAAMGSVMTILFLVIVWRYFARLQAAVREANWPDGGAAMDMIRKLVATNLALGVFTVALAVLGL